jgi:hypothetical protein
MFTNRARRRFRSRDKLAFSPERAGVQIGVGPAARRVAAPVGMVSPTIRTLIVIPAIYTLAKQRELGTKAE